MTHDDQDQQTSRGLSTRCLHAGEARPARRHPYPAGPRNRERLRGPGCGRTRLGVAAAPYA